MVAVGQGNVFGMRVRSVDGAMLEVICDVCKAVGYVPAAEFNATRCGSARCASSQGRTE